MMAKNIVRQLLFFCRGVPWGARCVATCKPPTDSPYIGRVTVMVVPSFSLLFKAMVP